MKKGISLRIIILFGWVLAMLLPLYSFSRGSDSTRLAFDRQASHIVAHMFLYAVLAYLLASVLFQSGLSVNRVFLFVIIAVLAVGVLQEGFQMISEHVALGYDEVFDISVDLAGGIIGTMLYIKVLNYRRLS